MLCIGGVKYTFSMFGKYSPNVENLALLYTIIGFIIPYVYSSIEKYSST